MSMTFEITRCEICKLISTHWHFLWYVNSASGRELRI